jgi:hypothetical protein
MPRNRLPRVMKHYSPTGRRNYGRTLKRLLDTWDRNGSTSGPTPWQIHDDDYDRVRDKWSDEKWHRLERFHGYSKEISPIVVPAHDVSIERKVDTDPLVNFGSIRYWVVSSTPWPLYSQQYYFSYPLNKKLREPQSRCGRFGGNFLAPDE